ncbi:MFS general substrate transporter [Auricularia subglabra TFB-10046 SS5]|nr:MFS general substrate transporter [Auricularia subglabra TFB-10046 SS5]
MTAEKRAIWKLDAYLVIPLMLFYLLSFIDRTNIGNARVGGLQKALNITDSQYSLSLTVTYISHACVEIPSNLLYKRIGPHILMPTMVVLWGTVATLQGLVKSYSGLLAARFFLGFCEGGLLPGVTLYISSFYPRRILQLRLAVLFTATSLAGAFSGLLATGILHMDGVGGLAGWAWIFILEGILTVVIGVAVAFFLPSSLHTARYLTPEQKAAMDGLLAPDGLSHAKSGHSHLNWREVTDALTAPHLWLICPIFFFNGARLFGLAVFAPSIVNSLIKNQPIRAQLLSVPPFAVAFVVSLASAFVSDRYGQRGACIAVFSTISIIGYTIFFKSADSRLNYFALFLQMVGAYGVPAALSAWTANNFSPHYKRATALAVVFIMSISGGILSTWIFTDPPRYLRATRINLAFSVCEVVLAGVNVAYLRHVNKTKAARVAQSAEPSDDGDEKGGAVTVSEVKEVDDRDASFKYCL